MPRRLRTTLVVLVCTGITAGAAVAQTGGADSSVKPRTGGPSTRFVVSFRAPQSAGRTTVSQISYEVSADRAARSRTCTWSAATTVAQATAGSMLHVTLGPSAGRRWCGGVFHGRIQEFIAPFCTGCPRPLGPPIACPLVPVRVICPAFLPAPRMIGTFTFRVHRRTVHPH